MADFDLIQTDAQVQSILNDGQNMQGAGAQTTLTTESVLLKDVNGNYHKILKSSFTEAIRDTLAGLLVNNDKGTTISQIAAIASGDFGSITPANLASVLGVYPKSLTMVKGQEYTIGRNDGGSCVLLLSESNFHGYSFIGAIHYQDGITSSVNRNNAVTFGENSSGDIVVYYKDDYNVRIKYKGSDDRNIDIQYSILE